jgi:RNA polymerase sigma factor for flagellar operon FliA
LLDEYAPLVKYVIDRFMLVLPKNVDKDDLLSAAVMGLLDAIEDYNPKRGVKFESYALPRIRGAVLDQLRAMDWVPRSLRRKARMVEQALGQLETSLGRAPSDEEVAAYLEVDLETYRGMLMDVNVISFVSLDEPLVQGNDQGGTLQDILEDPYGSNPELELEEEDLREQLARAIEQLPERKRLVIALYYYEELTLKEIGQVMGITESRVCQIHAEAILFLRSKLNRSRQFELAGLFR